MLVEMNDRVPTAGTEFKQGPLVVRGRVAQRVIDQFAQVRSLRFVVLRRAEVRPKPGEVGVEAGGVGHGAHHIGGATLHPEGCCVRAV